MYHFISYTLFCPEHTIPLKAIINFTIVAKDGLFWLSIVMSQQLICDVMERGVLVLQCPIRRLFLHVQIGAKVISTSEQ